MQGVGKQAGQEVLECPDCDNCEDNDNKKSSNEASKQKEKDEVVMLLWVACATAVQSLPTTIIK